MTIRLQELIISKKRSATVLCVDSKRVESRCRHPHDLDPSTTRRELSKLLEEEYYGLATSGSFERKFNQANTSASTRSELNATMFQKAGIGDQDLPND